MAYLGKQKSQSNVSAGGLGDLLGGLLGGGGSAQSSGGGGLMDMVTGLLDKALKTEVPWTIFWACLLKDNSL